MAVPLTASRRSLIASITSFSSSYNSTLFPVWRVPVTLMTLTSLTSLFLTPIPSPSSILQDIWDGILRAVPKKKMSYSRTRSRRLAGKGLKDIMSIVRCPSCGRPKRSHFLCPYCVHAVQLFWKKAWKDLGVPTSGTKAATKTLKDSDSIQETEKS